MVQFNSDANYPEFTSEAAGLRAQSQDAPVSDASRESRVPR